MSVAAGQRPRIAVAVSDARPEAGSVSTVALHQARELARRFEVVLVSDRLPERLPEGVAGSRVAARSYTWLFRFAHVPAQYRFAQRVGARLIELDRQQPISALVAHSHALALIAGGALARRHGAKVALVTHGDIFDRPPGTYDSRLTWFYRRVTPPAYRAADLVVALSPHMAECAKRGGAASANVRLLPNGIAPEELGVDVSRSRFADGNASSEPSLPIRLLYVGALGVQKGVDLLIDACARLAAEGVDFTLELVGAGTEQRALEARVAALGLGGNVRLLGRRPRAELGAELARVDLVVVPSRSEPLATVLLEALVAERPVVATAVGGNPFLVKDGENGLLVPAEDPRALAAAIARLARDRALLDRLARGARPSVWPAFSWGERGAALAAALAEVIATRSAEGAR